MKSCFQERTQDGNFESMITQCFSDDLRQLSLPGFATRCEGQPSILQAYGVQGISIINGKECVQSSLLCSNSQRSQRQQHARWAFSPFLFWFEVNACEILCVKTPGTVPVFQSVLNSWQFPSPFSFRNSAARQQWCQSAWSMLTRACVPSWVKVIFILR